MSPTGQEVKNGVYTTFDKLQDGSFYVKTISGWKLVEGKNVALMKNEVNGKESILLKDLDTFNVALVAEDTPKIKRLGANNYGTWRRQMKML
jgi:hypothetical protein